MKNKNLFRLIGIFGGFALLLIAFLLFSAPFVSITEKAFGSNGTLTGYELAFPQNGDAVAGVVATWVFSLILLILSIGVVVVFVLQLAGVLKWKETSIIAYLCGGCFAAVGLLVGILAFCALAFTGWKDTSVFTYGLGAGAVFTAILSILGGAGMCFGIVAPFVLKK